MGRGAWAQQSGAGCGCSLLSLLLLLCRLLVLVVPVPVPVPVPVLVLALAYCIAGGGAIRTQLGSGIGTQHPVDDDDGGEGRPAWADRAGGQDWTAPSRLTACCVAWLV